MLSIHGMTVSTPGDGEGPLMLATGGVSRHQRRAARGKVKKIDEIYIKKKS